MDLVESCLRVISSYKPSPMLWPLSSLLVPHSKYKQNRIKKKKGYHCNYSCIVVGQGRVVVVVFINTLFPP